MIENNHEMRKWRHDIHRHPELGFDEGRTAGKIAELLKSFGLEVHENIGTTGVVGVLKRGTSEKTIGLRADMDALPIQEMGEWGHKSVNEGVFHGCGHDGHTAMLLGAAKHLAERGEFDGTVYFIFQPSEENGLGALAMMDDGLFDRFKMDAIYGLHNMPGIAFGEIALRPGQMMTSEDCFVIEIKGKGGHASMPHMTLDPMVVGVEVVTVLQSIISRSLGPEEWGVLSVTEFLTDGARNIIPSNVTIKGDVRTLDPEVQKKIEKRMGEIVHSLCEAHGIKGSLQYSYEFIALKNSDDQAKSAAQAAIDTVGADKVDDSCSICPCSEDFAQFLNYVPGCFVLLGAGDGDDHPPLHNPYYDYEDELLTIGANYWANLVSQQLV
ncbi:MAG: amidohydrolase [Kordiimonadaceae bacterium]|jgi:amidohydrolase|nr:amidohydrolase [Kordiimonadaceae bacterium]MBT6037597.1 amidohydrolase [Kordiimonadaceae bacterium]MBT7581536.1 amidohydrolase [Kordiimonadaceae bacterium]